jgi:hypothetical protein
MLNPQNQVIANNILKQCDAERDRGLEYQRKKNDRAAFLTHFDEFVRNIVQPALTEVNEALHVERLKLEIFECERSNGISMAFGVTPSPTIEFYADPESAIVRIESFWPNSRKRSAHGARYEDHYNISACSIDELTVPGEVEEHLLRFVRTSMERVSFVRRIG